MGMEEHLERLERLKGLLREAFILLPAFERGESTQQVDELFQDICKLVFTDDFYLHVWDEGALNQLVSFFKIKSPKVTVYRERLTKLSERKNFVQQVNELFFSIISNRSTVTEVCERLSPFLKIEECDVLKLKASDHLQSIRNREFPTSEKVEAFIDHLIQDLGFDLRDKEKDLKNVIESIKAQEMPGKVNSLMVGMTSI